MSFFGFDTAMPGRPGQNQQQQGQAQQAQQQGAFSGFANESNTAFGGFNSAGAEEDVAVYTWGESALEEGGDAFNDETFGDSGPIRMFFVNQPLHALTRAGDW